MCGFLYVECFFGWVQGFFRCSLSDLWFIIGFDLGCLLYFLEVHLMIGCICFLCVY